MTEFDHQDIKLEIDKLLNKNQNQYSLDNNRRLARQASMQPDIKLDTNRILKSHQNHYSLDNNRLLAEQSVNVTETDLTEVYQQSLKSETSKLLDANQHVKLEIDKLTLNKHQNHISFDQTSNFTEADFKEVNEQNSKLDKSNLIYTNQNHNSLDISRNHPRQKSLIIESQFKEIMQKHRISLFFAKKLKNLNSFKIVFILDDSGSMNTILEESPLNKGSFKATRWDELQEFIKISIEIASVVNPEGCDVYFLNRRMVKNVKKPEDIASSFKRKPSGFTPITRRLTTVLRNNMPNVLNEKKLLVVIVTDGEPTNVEGKVDIKSFKECLSSRPSNVYTTILACTDENESMEYLNNWDKNIQRLDVVDDFRSEKKELMHAKGLNFQFSYGDYVAKSLIGSTDPKIDNMVENSNKGCCVVS